MSFSVAPEFDISIVLNLHNETRFLKRTLLSLEEATLFCRHHGLTTEIVVVLDRPTPSLREWVEAYDFKRVFDGCRIAIVDNGSLGLSRNSGVDLAKGEYIALADADDLVSYNMFLELFLTVKSRGRHAIAVAQYWRGFGDNHHVMEYFGTDKVSKLAFFQYHPYVSRTFAHNHVFRTLRFGDVSLKTGYAYEDWHHNAECVVAGYEFVVAPNTVMFYRQRAGSLLRSANATTAKCIPHSKYFEPNVFIRSCRYDYKRFSDDEISRKSHRQVRSDFLNNPLCEELLIAAQNIDPAIAIGGDEDMYFGSNLDGDLEPAAAYYRICQLLSSSSVENCTDVVLLPFLTKGGADKYITDVLSALAELDPSRRMLVLAGQKFDQHSWLDRLPANSTFIDVYEHCRYCYNVEDAVHLVTLRLIQALASEGTLHLKSSEYSARFFAKYNGVLDRNSVVYYRFCDARRYMQGQSYMLGYEFNFLSEYADQIDVIITDNAVTAAHDCERLDVLAGKYHVLYATQPVGHVEEKPRSLTRRLLWASRLDRQKRPELLPILGRELKATGSDVVIDVYGAAVMEHFNVNLFSGSSNIKYMGPFDGFVSLPHGQYDAFVYTSHFDGLPNVLLEAMAMGLPIVAPDVDGICEAVMDGKTGFLVPNHASDEELAKAYVAAISQLYSNARELEVIRASGRQLIASRHSRENYLESVARIFQVQPLETGDTVPLAADAVAAFAKVSG
jgi:glycosyltransferase involved in cell wall biosynthesis